MNSNDDLLKKFDELLVARLEPVNQRLGAIEKRQDSLEKGQNTLQEGQNTLNKGQQGLIQKQVSFEKELKKQGKKLDYVKETLDVAVNVFDRGDVALRKRVHRLEKHAGLPPFE